MKKKKSDLIEYLEAIKKLHRGNLLGAAYYKWILENGKLFTEKDQDRKFTKYFRKRANGCYYNAQMLSLDNRKLKYFEGWGITEAVGIPLEHGFNVIDGKVIDISWSDGKEYFGVEIPKDFIRKEMLRTETAGTILFRWFEKSTGRKK